LGGVVFFGYGDLAVAGIDALTSAGASIAAVVVPGNRAGADIAIIEREAERRRLPLWIQPPRRDHALFLEALRAVSPDVIIVWSYSMILPPDVLAVPRHGAVNVHGGLLPGYRGGHVTQWAIINGETESGATLHYMDDGIDTGPVIASARFTIEEEDDASHVRAKLRSAGGALLEQWWPRIADGTAPRIPQDDSRARYWRLRTPEDGRIAWTMRADDICRLVRALACNVPGAFIDVNGARISIRRAQLLRAGDSKAPGAVVGVDARGVRIAASGGDVLVTEAVTGGRVVTGEALASLMPEPVR
jgi:methionyl-tRNA formyltransferase